MAGRERLSRQELIRRQRRDGFVGRRSELATFRENLALPPEQAQFLFHIRGQAGVGKSTLVGQLAGVAREQGAVTAVVDESTASVVEAMEAVAAQLGRQGLTLKGVEKQLAAYRQRRHEAEAGGAVGPGGTGAAGTTGATGGIAVSVEPPVPSGQLGQSAQRGPAGAAHEANPGSPVIPSGAPAPATAPPPGPPPTSPSPSTSSVIASQVGLAGLGMVPGLGAFAGAVDPHQIAVGADRLRAMLSARFRNQDDVQLVLSPLHVLTPVLLEDLHEAAQRTPWITLFFDTYERTGPVLDVWLRDVLFTERYGSLPANVLVVLAGQNRLDTRCWGDHLEFVTDLPLEVFTESEARQLLSDKGVSDERTAQVILRLSGRLPVLLSTLAESRPAGAEDVGDPSGTAVERFLKWESDPARRAAALACALPQELDEDVYRAAAGGYAAQGFGWLRTLPFVNDRGGRCTYHDVVRTAMLRLQRTASPRGWQEQHGRLAAAFRAWRLQLQDGDPDRTSMSWWDEARWREYRLQETYHLLCADERTALPGALRELLDAYDHGIGTLRRWVRTLARADDDTTAAGLDGLDGHGLDGRSLVGTGGAEPHSGSELAGWGRRLSAALEAEDGAGIAVLTLLLTRGGLDEPERARALTLRALDHHAADSHERALADFDAALALTPDDVEALHGRGRTYLAAHRDDEALADFDHALELEPGNAPDTVNRALTYAVTGRHDEAAAGFDRALEILATEEPATEWDALRAKATVFAVHCVREHWDRAAETFEDFVAGAPDAALRRDAATELEMLTDVLPSLTERIAPYRRRLTEQP